MPNAVSYEGKTLRYVTVGPPGPNSGRRTTHCCVCKCQRSPPFVVTRADIQRALAGGPLNPRCDLCRKQRPPKHNLIGTRAGNYDLTARLDNTVLPGARTELTYLGRCRCDAHTEVALTYSVIKKQLAGRRKYPLSCGCCELDLTGQTFGLWRVLQAAPPPVGKEYQQQRWWLVQCQGCCGGEKKVVSTSDLRKKRGTKDCGCQAGPRQTQIWEQRRESIEIIGIRKLRKGIHRTARARGLEFDLTEKLCATLLFAPCTYCGSNCRQHTNVEVWAGKYRGRSKNLQHDIGAIMHGGIDRIDPSRGYVPDNVCPACKLCNIMKGTMTARGFMVWIASVYAKTQSLIKTAERGCVPIDMLVAQTRRSVRKETVRQLQCLPEKVRLHIKSALYSSLTRCCQRYPNEPPIDKTTFLDLLYRDCTYCGTSPANRYESHERFGPVQYRGVPRIYRYTGLDRVNSSVGYTSDNVTPCCGKCNLAKRDLTVGDFFQHIRRIVQHWLEE